jgi:hypothetical protein
MEKASDLRFVTAKRCFRAPAMGSNLPHIQ